MIIQKTVPIVVTINGQKKSLEVDASMTALELIRNILKLKGAKEGCGIGECGACTIRVNGKAVNACIMMAAQLDGRDIQTVEGLKTQGDLDPVQASFLNHNAVQCGFCTPGLLMSTHALLDDNPNPGRQEISKAIAGNLCRCTGYQQIFTSIEQAVASRNREKE